MKLVINYDFFNAVLDVNEGYTLFKVIRNNKRYYATYFTILTILDLFASKNNNCNFKDLIPIQTSFFFIGHYLIPKALNVDFYKEKSEQNLKQLSLKLNEYFIKTDYDLLKQSELLKRKYKIHINKDKMIEIMEKKYILVPTYDFNNNIKNTGILQEHVIGTDEYVLSLGSPKKELKLVYSRT